MTQANILEFLERNPNKWFDPKQIREAVSQSRNSTSTNLKSLRKTNFIRFKERAYDYGYNHYIYRYNKSGKDIDVVNI